MIKGLDHVGVAVSDMAKSLDFYTRQLGFQVVEEFDVPQFNVHCVFLKAGDGMIELLDYAAKGSFQKPPPSPLGLRHFTMRVEDLDGVYEKFVKAGFTFTRVPSVIVPGRIRNAFLLGPDGETVEFIERTG